MRVRSACAAYGVLPTDACECTFVPRARRAALYRPACVKRFRENEYRDHGIAVAQAVTARPLTDEQRAALTEKLRALTGKSILLETRTDASLLGGVRVNVEGRTYDNTLRNRIDEIGQALRTDA